MARRVEITSRNFLRGQTDTRTSKGLELPSLLYFRNMRGDAGTAKRRLGYRTTTGPTWTDEPSRGIESSIAGSHYATIDTTQNGMWILSEDYTFDFAFQPASVTGSQTWIAPNHASDWPIKITSSGTTLTISVVGGLATATHTIATSSIYYIRVTRRGTTVKFYVNGVLIQTSTAAGTSGWSSGQAYLFVDQGIVNGGVGIIYWVRVFDRAARSWKGSFDHYPYPRAPWVRYYLTGDMIDPTYFRDWSRMRLHALGHNGIGGSSARVNAEGNYVQGIGEIQDETGRVFQVMVGGGETFYPEVEA